MTTYPLARDARESYIENMTTTTGHIDYALGEASISGESMYHYGFDAGQDDARDGSPVSVDPAEDGQDYTDGYLAGYASVR